MSQETGHRGSESFCRDPGPRHSILYSARHPTFLYGGPTVRAVALCSAISINSRTFSHHASGTKEAEALDEFGK